MTLETTYGGKGIRPRGRAAQGRLRECHQGNAFEDANGRIRENDVQELRVRDGENLQRSQEQQEAPVARKVDGGRHGDDSERLRLLPALSLNGRRGAQTDGVPLPDSRPGPAEESGSVARTGSVLPSPRYGPRARSALLDAGLPGIPDGLSTGERAAGEGPGLSIAPHPGAGEGCGTRRERLLNVAPRRSSGDPPRNAGLAGSDGPGGKRIRPAIPKARGDVRVRFEPNPAARFAGGGDSPPRASRSPAVIRSRVVEGENGAAGNPGHARPSQPRHDDSLLGDRGRRDGIRDGASLRVPENAVRVPCDRLSHGEKVDRRFRVLKRLPQSPPCGHGPFGTIALGIESYAALLRSLYRENVEERKLSILPPPQLGESRDLPGPPSFFDPQPIRDDGGSPSPAGAE